jgi:hypothetical protein
VVDRLTDGTGNFDGERMLSTLPSELGLDAGKAAKLVADLAKERKRTTLVQVSGGCNICFRGWCGGCCGACTWADCVSEPPCMPQ